MVDLSEILRGHEGEQIYCLLTGEYVTIDSILKRSYRPIIVRDKNGAKWPYPKGGYKYDDYPDGECMLVPSKTERNWENFNRIMNIKNIERVQKLLEKRKSLLEEREILTTDSNKYSLSIIGYKNYNRIIDYDISDELVKEFLKKKVEAIDNALKDIEEELKTL